MEQLKACLDLGSLGILLASLAGILTPIATITTIVWTLFRIYDTTLGKKLFRRLNRKTRR